MTSAEELIASLDAMGSSAGYSATLLRTSYRTQRALMAWMTGMRDREEVDAAEIDAVLLRWLHCCYLHVSSVPGLSHRSGSLPLAQIMATAGVLAPFANVDEGQLVVGLPTQSDARCDSLSELLRAAGAAVVTYVDYLTEPARPGVIPSDDSSLMMSSLVISSLQDEVIKERLKAEALAAAETDIQLAEGADGAAAPPGTELPEYASPSSFGVAEIRWLMHWLRAELSGHFGDVRFVLGDRVGHKDCLVAAQQDQLCLLKMVPSNLAGFVLYCRACMAFQQAKAAHIFATKGVVVAEALHDDAFRAQLLLLRATAAVLGGAGSVFSLTDVRDARAEALTAKDKCTEWMPEQFHPLLELEPELHIVTEVLEGPAAAEADNNEMPVLDMMYTLPEPTSLPPGAVAPKEDDNAGAAPSPGTDGGSNGGGSSAKGRHRATAKRK